MRTHACTCISAHVHAHEAGGANSTGLTHASRSLLPGADIDARQEDGPSPLELAARHLRSALQTDRESDSSYAAASLLVMASGEWTPATHSLFPASARSRASELVHLGYHLARTKGHGRSLTDVWVAGVMRFAVLR